MSEHRSEAEPAGLAYGLRPWLARRSERSSSKQSLQEPTATIRRMVAQ